jgi:hypothetical protein
VGHILKTFGIVDLPVIDEQTGKIDEKSALAWKCRSITMFCLFFIVLPFNLQKNLATLRYFSMVILCIVFITISVSLAQSPSYYKTYKDNPDYTITFLAKGFDIK